MKYRIKNSALTIFLALINALLFTSCFPLTSKTQTLTIDLQEINSSQTFLLKVDLGENEFVYKLEVTAWCDIEGEAELDGIIINSDTKKVILQENDYYFHEFELTVSAPQESRGKIKVKAKYYI